MMRNDITCDDMRKVLPTLDAESVDCCVTSPPYWSQRQYSGEQASVWGGDPECEHVWGETLSQRLRGHAHGSSAQVGNTLKDAQGPILKQGQFCQKCGAWYGALGLEPTPELYVAHLVECFRPVKRVLKPWGTLWLNLGLKYDDKNLIHIPWLVALALQADGWWLRADCIWSKKSAMPQSVNTWRWERHHIKLADGDSILMPKDKGQGGKGMPGSTLAHPGWREEVREQGHIRGNKYADCPGCPRCAPHGGYILRYGAWRPTVSHEYVFLFSSSEQYYCDMDSVRRPLAESSVQRLAAPTPPLFGGTEKHEGYGTRLASGKEWSSDGRGANLRTVWDDISPEGYSGEHYAAYPTELAARCIQAGTSAKGYCPDCGRPWVRVIQRERPVGAGQADAELDGKDKLYREQGKAVWGGNQMSRSLSTIYKEATNTVQTTLDWWPTCDCEATRYLQEHPQEFPRSLDPRKCKAQDYSAWLTWEQRAKRRAVRLHADEWETKPGMVLDPFIGSGTTALAAMALGRHFIGVDISEDYCRQAQNRIRKGFTSTSRPQPVPKEQLGLGLF